MQYNEYMRRKQQAMPKIIGKPAPLESGTYIQFKQYQISKKCCTNPVTVYPVAVPCVTPLPEIGTATPGDSLLGIKPAVYYKEPACAPVYGSPPQLAAPVCFRTPGYQNTMLANNVPLELAANEYPSISSCASNHG